MLKAFISGPYSSDNPCRVREHVHTAGRYAHELLRLNIAPITPHTMYHGLDGGKVQYEEIMAACFALMESCDLVVAIPLWDTSAGAVREIERAEQLGIPIYFVEDEYLLSFPNNFIEWVDAYSEILDHARRIVLDVLNEGEEKYPFYSLHKMIHKEHIQHMKDHLAATIMQGEDYHGDNDLRHAVCRGVMESLRRVQLGYGIGDD